MSNYGFDREATEADIEQRCAGRWETVFASVTDRANDPEATAFEKTCTEFRIEVLTVEGHRFGMRNIVETGRLRKARHDLYGYVLRTMLRELEAALVNERQTAR